MPGIVELLLIGGVVLLTGGGGALMAMLRTRATQAAKTRLNAEVSALVPEEVRKAVGDVDTVARKVRAAVPAKDDAGA